MSNESRKYRNRYGLICVYKGTLERFNKLKVVKNLRADKLLNQMMDEFTKGDKSDTTCTTKD